MKNILKYLWLIPMTYLLFGANSVFGVSPGISDGLWQKAVVIATSNKNLSPGQMTVTSEELDNRGKVVHTDETWIRYFPGTSSQIESEILKATENGKDVTAERRQKTKEDQAKKEKNGSNEKKRDSVSINPFEAIPFTENKQDLVRISRLNLKESVLGHRCEVYEYTISKDKQASFKGKAWLDEENGIPIQIRYSPQPLPKNVTRMETVIVFSTTGNQFYPSEIRIEGSGGFLFIKKNLRMTMRCSDFWTSEQKPR